jgi:glycine dehydrogenase
VANGEFTVEHSPLRNAPHTAAAVISTDWTREYPREQAVFPVHTLKQDKYFPPVGRIDGAAGDRNLICSCPPLEAFEEDTAVHSNDSANSDSAN